MMRLRQVSVIAPLSLLACAATASAECAWVMWAYSRERGVGEQYSAESASSTRQECVNEVRVIAESMRSRGYTVTGGGPTSSEAIGRKDGTSFKYFCLPDTVDPRGPKGSR